MITIEQIWDTSRQNDYSWILPVVLVFGVLTLALLNFIKSDLNRRIAKVILFLGFSFLALQASSAAITEKWRIRHAWGDENWEQLSEQEQNALMTDGANLVLGPVLEGGGYAFWLFGGVLVLSRIIRFSAKKHQTQPQHSSEPPSSVRTA
jgi:hypothetical protein